jgi:pimeloyl-ACP methyl ester carboxylesterase
VIVTPPHRDRHLIVGGLRLHVVEHGAADDPRLPAVVLLHGVTGHAAVWSHVAPHLVASHTRDGPSGFR